MDESVLTWAATAVPSAAAVAASRGKYTPTSTAICVWGSWEGSCSVPPSGPWAVVKMMGWTDFRVADVGVSMLWLPR